MSSPALMYRFFNRVQVRSREGLFSGYFRGCTAYLDNGQLTVLLRHRRNPQLRRPFPVVALEPPTIELDNPQDYEGLIPHTPMAA
jgi:hypothetical protein